MGRAERPGHDRSLWASGPSLSLMDDDLVICCGGICCAAWKDSGKCGLFRQSMSMLIRKRLCPDAEIYQDAIENMELPGSSNNQEHDQTSIRWIEKLGFVREGLMMKFGPNQENQFMYAR